MTILSASGNARSSQTRDRLAKDLPEREPDGIILGFFVDRMDQFLIGFEGYTTVILNK